MTIITDRERAWKLEHELAHLIQEKGTVRKTVSALAPYEFMIEALKIFERAFDAVLIDRADFERLKPRLEQGVSVLPSEQRPDLSALGYAAALAEPLKPSL